MSLECTRLVAPLLVSLFASVASAGTPHIAVRYQKSFQGGGTTLTLWSDGYVEEVAIPGGPRVDAYHFSGRLPAKDLKQVTGALSKAGLTTARYTQQPRSRVMSSGFVRLEVWDGKQLNTLQSPPVMNPSAATRKLRALVTRCTAEFRKAVRPHLTTAGPAGVYAQAVLYFVGPAPKAAVAKQPAPLRAALLRPGSYVHLPGAQAKLVKQGQQTQLGKKTVAWVVTTLQTRKAPGAKAKQSKAGR